MKQIVYIAFIALLSLSVCDNIKAQERINYVKINELSYEYYLSGEWNKLIEIGKKAKEAGIDFYYLKVRMGVAYYNLKKYRQSIPFLESALTDSPDDVFILEYLYNAYIFSGRPSESLALSSKLTPEIKSKLKIKNKSAFSGLELETKFDTWKDYMVKGLSSDTIQQSVQHGYSYFGANTDFTFKRGSELLVGFSRVGVFEDDIWLDSDTVLTSIDRKVIQNQLYIGIIAKLAKGMNLVISTNLLFLSLDDEYTTIQSSSTLKAGFGNGPGSGSHSGSGFGTGSGSGSSSSISKYNSIIGNNFDYVAHIGLYKDFSLFKAGVFTTFSGINNNIQLQPGLSFTAYPLGNTNLYTVSTISYLFEKYDNSSSSNMIFKQSLGINVRGIYIEPSYTFGEFNNYTEGNGYIVNNSNDTPKNRLDILAYTHMFKGKLNLFFKYQNSERINYYIINNITQSINYNYQSFIGGIKWNF